MADKSEPVEIRHAPLVAFLRTIPRSETDPSPRFEFLGAAVVRGRKVGYFAADEELWRYINSANFYLNNLQHYYRTGDSTRLFLLAPKAA